MKKTMVLLILVLVGLVASSVLSGQMASFVAPTESHGFVSLTFDDGYQSQYDNAFPLMEERGIPGTFYVFTDSIRGYSTDSDFFMGVSELQALQNCGSEIGSHSKTHTAFTSLSDLEIEDECQTSKEVLQSFGLSVNNFCYPFGDRDERTDAIVDDYFGSARTIWNPNYVLPMPYSQFLVDGNEGEIGPELLSSLEGIVDQAYSTNQWAVIYFHQVLPDPNDGISISVQDFESLLDYIVSKGVIPLTINQALERTSPSSSQIAMTHD